MAIDQDLLDRVAASLADLYRDAETDLVNATAKAIRASVTGQNLTALRDLQAASRRTLAALQATRNPLIRKAILTAYRSGNARALDEVDARLFPASGRAAAPGLAAARAALPNAHLLQNIANALHRDIGRLDANLLRAPIDAFRAVQGAAASRILLGTATRLQASQATWKRLVDQGIVRFVDASGRPWRLSSYVEMTARTNAQRAAVQGQTDRMEALGLDLVIVSDNVQECKRCRPFEGKVLRRDSGPTGRITVQHATDDRQITVTVMDTLDGARAKGLFHPNCRHSVSTYLPGVTKPPARATPDPEGDKARQKQRYLERRIRAAKEQRIGALTAADGRAAKDAVSRASAALKAHLAAHPNLKRLPYRERIGAGNLPTASTTAVESLGPPVQEPLF